MGLSSFPKMTSLLRTGCVHTFNKLVTTFDIQMPLCLLGSHFNIDRYEHWQKFSKSQYLVGEGDMGFLFGFSDYISVCVI